LNFNEAPISQVLSPQGERSITRVTFGDHSLAVAVWRVKAGRANIYLLDTNVAENTLEDRQLSARLYTADPETRIQQEIILGIGGVRVLRALGIQPTVWHANEGHSAFMNLERIREEVASGRTFDEALKAYKRRLFLRLTLRCPAGMMFLHMV